MKYLVDRIQLGSKTTFLSVYFNFSNDEKPQSAFQPWVLWLACHCLFQGQDKNPSSPNRKNENVRSWWPPSDGAWSNEKILSLTHFILIWTDSPERYDRVLEAMGKEIVARIGSTGWRRRRSWQLRAQGYVCTQCAIRLVNIASVMLTLQGEAG